MFLDWHDEKQKHLIERFRLGNLPHAVLVYGDEGIGKVQAVKQIAQSLLCQKPAKHIACGECSACQLYESETHPNVTYIAPERNVEKNTISPIKIDSIRELSNKLVMTSQYSGPNIAIIEQAEMMNHFSANALLKTLEEPTANTIIFLVTHQISALLPTIRSRCQTYLLDKPKHATSLAWLQTQHDANEDVIEQALSIAAEAPLKALNYLQNDTLDNRQSFITSLASLLENKLGVKDIADLALKLDFVFVCNLLQSLLLDLIRQHSSADSSHIRNKDVSKLLRVLLKTTELDDAFALQDELVKMRRIDNPSISKQLMLESFFASWHNMTVINQKTA